MWYGLGLGPPPTLERIWLSFAWVEAADSLQPLQSFWFYSLQPSRGQQIRTLASSVSIGIMLDCQLYQTPLLSPMYTDTS